MAGGRVAHPLIGLGGLLDLAGEIDLVLKVAGRDFRAILLGEQEPDLVGQPIDHLMLLGGGAVEEIDEAPAQILDVAFERGEGKDVSLLLRHVGDEGRALPARYLVESAPLVVDAALRGLEDARENSEQSRFPASVRADESGEASAGEGQRQVLNHFEASIREGKSLGREDRHFGIASG